MRPTSHCYLFQGFPEGSLLTGVLRNGHQVLVGPLPPIVIILEFGEDGTLLRVHERAISDLTNCESLKNAVSDCFHASGAIPGVIRMLRLTPDNPESPLADIQRRHHCAIRIDDF